MRDLSDEYIELLWQQAVALVEARGEDIDTVVGQAAEGILAWQDFLRDSNNALAYDGLFEDDEDFDL